MLFLQDQELSNDVPEFLASARRQEKEIEANRLERKRQNLSRTSQKNELKMDHGLSCKM